MTTPPSPWITRHAARVSRGGRVLDLAAGSGRHSRWLAAQGFKVLAVDRDAGALAGLSGTPGLDTRLMELEGADWPLAGLCFAGIVVANYLYRPRLGLLATMLEPGGVLLYETFACGHERLGRPRNPDYLLQPGELLDVFMGPLRLVAYEHLLDVSSGQPAIRQRICAVRE
jgi:SAM-dependent methyltransferase